MKSVLAVVLCVMLGQAAQAKVYECVMQEQVDPWSRSTEGSDIWRAYVDEAERIVELQSDNWIFGDNPFAILNRAFSTPGVAGDVQHYVGINRYQPEARYVFKFDKAKKVAYLETREGKRPLVTDEFSCRPIVGKIPRD